MRKKYSIKKIKEFDIKQIAESGQVFRWNEDNNGGYTAVVYGKVINVIETDSEIIFNGIDKLEYDEIFEEYFDLKRNYKNLVEKYKLKDENLKKAVDYGFGIRILKQELWEMIISYIISANNNIPRIKKAIEEISMKYGVFIESIEGKDYYSFPTPIELSKASVEDLKACGVGYRDSYIYITTKMVVEGKVDLDKLEGKDVSEARMELKKLMGVGDKVADCIMLFGLGKLDVFPVDTWVKKILDIYYDVKLNNNNKINKFAVDYFGEECGVAQQYLFYYMRENSKE